MFTGLIEKLGEIIQTNFTSRDGFLSISAGDLMPEIHPGDSISVNGVCLTAQKLFKNSFEAYASSETLQRSTLRSFKAGQKVNLELAMRADGRFGGHIVQGHVDGLGDLKNISRIADGWEMAFSYPIEMAPLIVEKGSIAVDGISLTIAHLDEMSFKIAVIPHTFEKTNLHLLKTGDSVNLEADIFAKYIARMLKFADGQKKGMDERFLKEHGFWSD